MKNEHKTLNDRTLLGLKKRIPTIKPKEERILETVNELCPESKMTKGTINEETPIPDLLENARHHQRRYDYYLHQT